MEKRNPHKSTRREGVSAGVDRVEGVVRRAEEKRGYSPFWLRFMG